MKNKKSILIKQNILISPNYSKKDEILTAISQILQNSGYVSDGFLESLRQKEEEFDTCIGNGVAIPHAISSTKKDVILNSGLVIMTFPHGVKWNKDKLVHLVIAIAAIGDQHIEILSDIAINCSTEENVKKIANSSQDEIYAMFGD